MRLAITMTFALLASLETASADKINFEVATYTAFKALTLQLAGPKPGFVWYQTCQINGFAQFQTWTVNGFHVDGRTIQIIHLLGVGPLPISFTADFPQAVNIDCSSGTSLATIN